MAEVNVRELRNHGGDVPDRVSAGEQVTVVRAGKAIAPLSPLPCPGLGPAELVSRRRTLPTVDPKGLGRDIDSVLGAAL